jgi:HAD superfamily hydrolase (TIGR01509 family)
MQSLAHHLMIPTGTTALLWDMDGVLIDSLGLDVAICAPLFSRHLQRPVRLDAPLIRSFFALDPKNFIAALLQEAGKQHQQTYALELAAPILAEYITERQQAVFPLLPGVLDTIAHARAAGLRQAVVSNNPQADLGTILKACGLYTLFDCVIGNDGQQDGVPLQKKPAPDYYLAACRQLQVAPQTCVVFEDSVIGCQAGLSAGAYVIGLLSGSADLAELQAMRPAPHAIFPDLLSPASYP